MGSFGGVKIDAQNFNETVALAQEKALFQQQLIDQNRVNTLAQSLQDYRVNLLNSTFPDGQYYITSDFNSTLVQFQGGKYSTNEIIAVMPVVRQFKRGELVTVITTPTNMAGGVAKAIQTDSGNFYADQNRLSKTKPVDPVTTESLSETRAKNVNKTTVMIIGAFILGFLLSND